jgi:lipoprotein-releasing system ATP-binding protein
MKMKDGARVTAQSSKSEAAGDEPAGRRVELRVEGLRKSFRSAAGEQLEVLRGVSFEVRAGELLAVVGASGAGKSTLLHVLGGLERADGGEARFQQFDIVRAGESELARWRGREVGFVFQAHRLLADLSAVENVMLPLLVARKQRREAREEAARALSAVGLAERARHAAGELSGGEQQRVAVARALVAGARLLLCDEPTGNLDARTAEETCALLFALCRERGACGLIATHNERLASACDRVLLLRDGRIVEP